MKRGRVLTLIIGLTLMLSTQSAFAQGGPKKDSEKGPKAARIESVKTQDQPDAEEKAAPKPTKGSKGEAKAKRNSKGNPKPKAAHAPVRKANGKSKHEQVGAPVASPSRGAESVEPVATAAPVTVMLHSAHVGANSETFGRENDSGGLSDAVVWHFVLNGLDHGTEPAQLTVTFKYGGTRTAVGIPVGNGSTQHFYVGTPTHDILLSGSAVVKSCDTGKLVLSHVSWCGEPGPGEPGTPGDDDGDDDDEPECPPVKPIDDKPVPPVPPVVPVVNQSSTATTATVSEGYLPYTGDSGALLLGAAAWSAMIGGTFRVRSRKRR